MSESRAVVERVDDAGEGRWQLIAGLIVLLGCLATVAYTLIETFWG